MIIIGTNAEYEDGRIDYWFSYEPDIHSAKAVVHANNERNYCDRRGIIKNQFYFHDTETKRTWSVHGNGLSKRNYITEETKSFLDRIKKGRAAHEMG